MRIVIVQSEYDDFGVLVFEGSNLTIKEVVDYIEQSGEDSIVLPVYDQMVDDYCDIRFTLREFGDVDPEFIDFVKSDIMDSDDAKHHYFYVVYE